MNGSFSLAWMSRFRITNADNFVLQLICFFISFSKNFSINIHPEGIWEWWKYIIKTISSFLFPIQANSVKKAISSLSFHHIVTNNICFFPFRTLSLIRIDRRVQKVILEIVYCINWYLRRAWVAKTLKWDLYVIEITLNFLFW